MKLTVHFAKWTGRAPVHFDTANQLTGLAWADLSGADLRGKYLCGVDMHGADLRSAEFRGAGLDNANFDKAQLPFFQIPQEGTLTVWGREPHHLIKLEIPSEARRTACLVSRECRAESALILQVDNIHGYTCPYTPGQLVRPHDYCDDIRIDSAAGVRFFLTKEEALFAGGYLVIHQQKEGKET